MTASLRQRVYGSYLSKSGVVGGDDPRASLAGRHPYLKRLVREHFPPAHDARIVDVGCGHGQLIDCARNAGYKNVTGVDGSAEQVAAAARLGIDGIQQEDAFRYIRALHEASIDCVVSFDVIEHFDDDELIGFCDEVLRVLRVGGKWIVHVPNAEGPFGGRMRYWDMTHERAFTATSIKQLLLASGFGTVECFEDQPVPHGVKSACRWVLWKFLRAGMRFYLAVETGDIARHSVLTQNLLAVATKHE